MTVKFSQRSPRSIISNVWESSLSENTARVKRKLPGGKQIEIYKIRHGYLNTELKKLQILYSIYAYTLWTALCISVTSDTLCQLKSYQLLHNFETLNANRPRVTFSCDVPCYDRRTCSEQYARWVYSITVEPRYVDRRKRGQQSSTVDERCWQQLATIDCRDDMF